MRAPLPRLLRWMVPLGALLALAGYFGPWVDHRAAGLVITGLDLGEYVKFLPEVRSGALRVWRLGYYLPLIAVSLALSLYAFRPEPAFGRFVRLLLLVPAAVAALNLLPPAWTPPLLLTPEFRTQTALLALCLLALLSSPFLALLPGLLPALLVPLLAAAALAVPVAQFLAIRPAVAALYAAPLRTGWGPWVMGAGLLVLAFGALTQTREQPTCDAKAQRREGFAKNSNSNGKKQQKNC